MSAPDHETPRPQPSMSRLLASCAAAREVSTPPRLDDRVRERVRDEGRRRAVAAAKRAVAQRDVAQRDVAQRDVAQREAAPHRDAA
ncbi:hypothetical protein [Streptomyces sp. KLOTTS4A1]|uniref:hypothetical protein n=1 Tax=Streptomyces sp. KLOTTS4A1 TaxID=3390996 RepID=UPI0039F5624C